MTYGHITESYVDSKVKAALRKLHIDAVIDISKRHKRPANLKYLTLAGARAIDARMLHASAPDVYIHAIECYENQLHEMAKNGPIGMASEFDDMNDFLVNYKALPSGIGDPACDGHFIGAFFDWYGGLAREYTLAAMRFVHDHRFIKPGFRTAIAFTYNKKARLRARIDESFARSLYRRDGEGHRFYNVDSAAEYSMLALSEASPALEVELLHKEEYRNRPNSDPMFFILVEARKPRWAPEFPSPDSRIRKHSDGSMTIGGLTLPGGPSMLTLVTGAAAPVAVDPRIRAEFDLFCRQRRLNRTEIDLLDRALSGGTQPMGRSPLGITLYRWRKEQAKSPHLALLRKLRPDWETGPVGQRKAA